MSESKTLITHARTECARFLGYAISIFHSNDKLSRRAETRIKTRSVNGGIRLGIPAGLIEEKAQRYQRYGKPAHEPALLAYSDAHIIDTYQQRFRGLAEYYKYATDRNKLSNLKYLMEVALTKTMANKFKTAVTDIYRRYGGTHFVDGFLYKTLQVEVPTSKGSRCVRWGAVPLKVVKPGTERIHDNKYLEKMQGLFTDLVQRLQANQCELCDSRENCEVHHIRKLADLKERWKGRKVKPLWVKRMIALRRKTLVVCHKCHVDIHAGRATPNKRRKSSGEPGDAKVSRPVRRGVVGKVPILVTR